MTVALSVADLFASSPYTICAHCGITDQAPKVVQGGPWVDPAVHGTQYHHDCTPAYLQTQIEQGLINDHSPQHKLIVAQTFQACRESKRNQDLLAHILDLHAGIRPDNGEQMIFVAAVPETVLDAYFNGGASGSVVVGAVTYTLPYKLKWLSTLSTKGAAGTEWTGGSYPAGGVSMSGAWSTPASAGAKATTAAISVSNSPALTWADNEAVDATGTPIRLFAKGTPSLAISVTAGSTATVPSGSGTATLT